MAICGDVIGPVFPNNEPLTFESMFNSGHGRFGKGSEYHTFNLAANTWQLHYLRLTNQLNQKRQLAKTIFARNNVELTALMRRFSSQGWLSNWDDSGPSVWLTAWSVRQMSYVSFQDWEDFIYIDPRVRKIAVLIVRTDGPGRMRDFAEQIVSSAVLWLLNYQGGDGSFQETSEYKISGFHRAMASRKGSDPSALTAHVLLALEHTAFMLLVLDGVESIPKSNRLSQLTSCV